MIACHSKHLIERCLQRGYTLDEVTPCVVSMDGDIWTINVDHDSYPRGIGALSFKCVEDCTTPDFVCLPGYCCTENMFDGSNSCLPCSSSSSGSSSSSSSSSLCSIGGLTDFNSVKCCLYIDSNLTWPENCQTIVLGSICEECPPGSGNYNFTDSQISDISTPCFDWEPCGQASS